MKYSLFGLLFILATLFAGERPFNPLNAVVRVSVVSHTPNYAVPWQDLVQQSTSGSGVVIAGNRILTNAHNVADATYITVTKQNADQDFTAHVLAVSHDCDLAILSVEDKNFFNDITPLEIGQTPPPQTTVTVAGYPIGGNNLSITRGVISRIEIHMYMHSFCRLLAAQLDAAVNPGNSGGPVLYEDKIAGIAFQGNKRGEGLGYMIPTEIIRHFLTDIQDGRADGIGRLGFNISTLDNSGTRRYLKMKEGQTGVRVIHVSRETKHLLKEDDVLLSIDGVKIANNGNIRLSDNEARSFATLIHKKQVGEKVTLSLLRDGKELNVQLPIRKFEYVCHSWLYDQLPEYYIIGGFVFTPLSYSFLNELRNDTPQLGELMFQEKTSDDEEAVVISFVLADRVNIGYQGILAQQVTKVNGKKLKNLKELIHIVETSKDEFITFSIGKDNHPVTLALNEMRNATPGILKRYRVPADRSDSLMPKR